MGDLQQSLDWLIAESQDQACASGFSLNQFRPLFEAHYEPAVLFFVKLLDDPRAGWRESALKALLELAYLKQVMLKKVRRVLLHDDSEYVRLWAVRVIARHGAWVESVLVRALKVETVSFVRAVVFKTILELQELPKSRTRMAHDLVLARSIEGTFKDAEGFVAEWKAEQAASKAAEVRRKEALFEYRNTLYKRATLKAKPKLFYPDFQAFYTDLVKGKPLSARGVELLRANTNDEQGLNQYLEFVAQVGLCQVENGFLWLVDPADYEREVKRMFGSLDAAVFARTSFGWLFVMTREAVFELSPFHGEYASWADVNFERFFELICNPVTLQNMGLVEHQALVESLGTLEPFECYGRESRVNHYGDEFDEKLEIHAHLRFLLDLKPMCRMAEILN